MESLIYQHNSLQVETPLFESIFAMTLSTDLITMLQCLEKSRSSVMILPTSAQKLLKDYTSEIDFFDDILVGEGVEQLCFGLKKVLEGLKNKIVEIALDATCRWLHFLCRKLI